MTTPDERRRNLIWGREMLQDLAQEKGSQADWRESAAALLACYPTPDFMDQFNAANPAELAPYASVLVKVSLLFTRVQADARCSEQRRYSLRVVLRHLP